MSNTNIITGDMNIEEVVSKYPQTLGVFFQYGLGCIGCHAASYESLAEGVAAHGISLDAIRSYIRYYDWMNDIKGERVATITLAYNHKQRGIEDTLGNIQHKYLDIIRSSIHLHLENDYCMEVIILEGDGEKIKDLSENLVRHKGILHVKLNTINPTEI
jgi:CopG family nickel-responsive transcriptional regulator